MSNPEGAEPGYYATDEEINDWNRRHGRSWVEGNTIHEGDSLAADRPRSGTGVAAGGEPARSPRDRAPEEVDDTDTLTSPSPEGAEPAYCAIHQHYKWCEHNGGTMGPTGWRNPEGAVSEPSLDALKRALPPDTYDERSQWTQDSLARRILARLASEKSR